MGLLLPGQGGTVSYRVAVKGDAHTGDLVNSSARVIYDTDAPIDIATVTNTIDGTAPTTWTTLDQGGGNFQIAWQAKDDAAGSGVKDHTVYVSFDGGAYFAYLTRTTLNATVFKGLPGDTIGVIILSSDNAGNVEAAPDGTALPPYDAGADPDVLQPQLGAARPRPSRRARGG